MKQKQRHMKLLALTVVLLLTLTQLFTLSFADNEDVFETALADNEEGADNKPILSVDYLGISSEYEGPKPKQTVPIMESANVTFWVGVSVDKLNQVDFIKNHGLYSLEIGFDYNPTYVEPWGDLEEYSSLRVSSPELTKTEAWMKTLEKFNFGETATTMDENVWNSDLYELVQNDSVRAAGVDTDPWREEVVPENWKMGFVSIRKKDAAEKSEATNRFYGAADTGGKYILKMPFRLKSIPQDGSKPLVFKLSRGPSTLSMGAGANGYEDFAAWEREDRSEPEHNLKNIFTFGGDLNIFGGSSETGAMSDLTVSRTVDGAEEELDLHTDATLDTVVTYTPERLEYYVQVPAKTGEVTITMLGLSEAPTVTYSDNDATTNTLPVSASSGGYTADVTLVDVDMSKNDGFNNTVTIQVGEKSYLVHIRQLVEPKIVLNPGNSPYGMIERMSEKYHGAEGAWNDEKIAKAKEVFKSYDPVNGNLLFGVDAVFGSLIPDNVQNEIPYTTAAWGDGINYDMVPEAIFVYENQKFTDPGFSIYNHKGEEISEAKIDRYVVLKEQISAGFPRFDETNVRDLVIDIKDEESQYLFEQISNNTIIQPGVYELRYTYSSDDGEKVEIVRPMIILPKRGDIELTPIPGLNNNDATELMNNFLSIPDLNALFAFRTCDIELTPISGLNNNDATELMNNFLLGFNEFYTELQ